jgi:hypothetical protein
MRVVVVTRTSAQQRQAGPGIAVIGAADVRADNGVGNNEVQGSGFIEVGV